MNNASGEWSSLNWVCAAGVCTIVGGATGVINETNPSNPIVGKKYILIIDATDVSVDSGNPRFLFGGINKSLLGEGLNTFILTVIGTNEFSLQKNGGAPLSISSVTIKEDMQSDVSSMVVHNKITTKDINVTDTITVVSLNIEQVPTVAPIADALRVVGARPSDSSNKGSSIVLIAGNGSGTEVGGDINLTSGSTQAGSDTGNIRIRQRAKSG
ncbi:hypothetical protein LCGC14_3098940 [marine sediment metagenome]|uniref:Uncharacterized protein n=1 Tax=marine sediment metagenome TaxID=412755 RepID=A0A0F8YFS7_9ZZZZ